MSEIRGEITCEAIDKVYAGGSIKFTNCSKCSSVGERFGLYKAVAVTFIVHNADGEDLSTARLRRSPPGEEECGSTRVLHLPGSNATPIETQEFCNMQTGTPHFCPVQLLGSSFLTHRFAHGFLQPDVFALLNFSRIFDLYRTVLTLCFLSFICCTV